MVTSLDDCARSIIAGAEGASYAAKVKAVRELEPYLSDLSTRVRIRVLRNFTIEPIGPLIRLECARAGIVADVSFSDFDTYEQEVLDPASPTRSGQQDVVVMSLWLSETAATDSRTFQARPSPERIVDLIEMLKKEVTSTIVATTFLPPLFSPDPIRVHKSTSQTRDVVAEANSRLLALAQSHSALHAIDLARLSARLGERASFDPRFWYLYKAPLKNELLDLVAREVGVLVGTARGTQKKVLVLDCDGTLWGGVVGEDGVNGIALDPHTYPGAAFYDFQRQVAGLKNRGVILALCSKNNDADVAAVFDQHPHCLLRREDFSDRRVNWTDKVVNLRELSASLNVGLDSFVFVDDSPAECEYVRRALPEVTVLQVPKQPFELPSILKSRPFFSGLATTAEDALRTDSYRQEARRREVRAAATDLPTYWRSLGLIADLRLGSVEDLPRIAQLTQKTNQFNLTTRRYTERELDQVIMSSDSRVMTMRVRDRFGDYGLTALAVIVFDGDVARIDTFLLSCRILGRQLEYVLLKALVDDAFARPGVLRVEAKYIPTPKNAQTADFFDQAGFSRLDGCDRGSGGRAYCFDRQASLQTPSFVSVILWKDAEGGTS